MKLGDDCPTCGEQVTGFRSDVQRYTHPESILPILVPGMSYYVPCGCAMPYYEAPAKPIPTAAEIEAADVEEELKQLLGVFVTDDDEVWREIIKRFRALEKRIGDLEGWRQDERWSNMGDDL